MKIKLIIILLIFNFIQVGYSQNTEWVKKDEAFIKEVIHLYKTNPENILEKFRAKKDLNNVTDIYMLHRIVDLGFNYKLYETGIGGSYISFKADFFYHFDTLVGYTLIPNLPKYQKLHKKYLGWYSELFQTDSVAHPLKHNSEIMDEPLSQYKGPISAEELTPQLAHFVSLNSRHMGLVEVIATRFYRTE